MDIEIQMPECTIDSSTLVHRLDVFKIPTVKSKFISLRFKLHFN